MHSTLHLQTSGFFPYCCVGRVPHTTTLSLQLMTTRGYWRAGLSVKAYLRGTVWLIPSHVVIHVYWTSYSQLIKCQQLLQQLWEPPQKKHPPQMFTENKAWTCVLLVCRRSESQLQSTRTGEQVHCTYSKKSTLFTGAISENVPLKSNGLRLWYNTCYTPNLSVLEQIQLPVPEQIPPLVPRQPPVLGLIQPLHCIAVVLKIRFQCRM